MMQDEVYQMSLSDLDLCSGKTSPEHSPPHKEKTSKRYLKKPSALQMTDYQFLDLRTGHGNMLGAYWETNAPWLGECWMHNTGASPKDAVESSLLQILQDTPHPKYYLSETACAGILRRSKERGKELPEPLRVALEIQAQQDQIEITDTDGMEAVKSYHINQRSEGIDLQGISGALMATQTLQMQTFIKDPFYCLNDQGGQYMNVSENVTGTLRAGMGGNTPIVMSSGQSGAQVYENLCPTITCAAGMGGGNQPILFENHGRDCRYNGPLDVAPTLAATGGMGGNNLPLVTNSSYCIAGNIIDRQTKNGGNGIGCQEDISYTLTSSDRHAVYQPVVGALCSGDEKGVGHQYVSQGKCIVNPATSRNLVRRLTPLECERLQGFPDGWTDIPKASDSPRYKALGNSVAIPCVAYVLQGIAFVLQKIRQEEQAVVSVPE